MKKILLSIIYFLACIYFIQAQTLYGTRYSGGSDGGGTIDKFIPSTDNLTISVSFESVAATPKDLMQASDGKLYGMTLAGGIADQGVIFSYDPVSLSYKTLFVFDGVHGSGPTGSLVQANDGKLYGMTRGGGSVSRGVIFSFEPSTSTYTKLKDFDYTNGADPYGSLVQASDGKFYGVTFGGGTNNKGVIFSLVPSTLTYTNLLDFYITTGRNPLNLMQASNGKLYGMTAFGGSGNAGVIFSFDPSSLTYAKLKDFDEISGFNPPGPLIQAKDGKLYGLTTNGGSNNRGVIFFLDPATSTYTKVKDFDNTNGCIPGGSLMEASDGKLYGTTEDGGSSDKGVIFSLVPASLTYTKLMDFDSTTGFGSSASLAQASDGKFYGTISGAPNIYYRGAIFSFDPFSLNYTRLTEFGPTEGGSNPSASLMQATDGKLYGMTTAGGANAVGVIFSFDPSTSIYTKLKDLEYVSGALPYGKLIQASNGKLYGMTTAGGANGGGVIFSIDPSVSVYTKSHDFDIKTGANPYGSLIQASDGKLYGMTRIGGAGNAGIGFLGAGVIFSFDPATLTYTKLLDFGLRSGGNFVGVQPYGDLMQASDGKLYGTTFYGGSNWNGVIFSFDPLSSTYTTLKDFDSTSGSPCGSLIQANDKKLYGMGNNGRGGLFFPLIPRLQIIPLSKDLIMSMVPLPGVIFCRQATASSMA